MSVIEKFSSELYKLKYEHLNGAERTVVNDHILDTVCATLTGLRTTEGQGVYLFLNNNGFGHLRTLNRTPFLKKRKTTKDELLHPTE